jgi:hypothetical protein
MPTDKLNAARARVLNLSPVAPPEKTINAIKTIGEEYKFGTEEVVSLVDDFLEFHNIDPEAPPAIAELRSHYRVLGSGDDGEILDDLVNAIIGETLEALNESAPGSWDEWFERRNSEYFREVEHVTSTMHADVARALLRIALGRLVFDKSDELFQNAFPHLKVGLATNHFVRALKEEGVLILGEDHGAGLALLERIGELLMRLHGKAPLLLKEQEDRDDLGLVAKLLINSAAARWVLVENSSPSGHLYELPFVDMVGVVVVVLQQEGRGASFMPDEAILKNAQWRRFTYPPDRLEDALGEAVRWAESTIASVRASHQRARPWQSVD